jgi:hypothetical protein
MEGPAAAPYGRVRLAIAAAFYEKPGPGAPFPKFVFIVAPSDTNFGNKGTSKYAGTSNRRH